MWEATPNRLPQVLRNLSTWRPRKRKRNRRPRPRARRRRAAESRPRRAARRPKLRRRPTIDALPAASTNGDAATNGESSRTASRQERPCAPARRATAQSMAAKQRDISVSEFFAKNRHLLGFDNPRKALLTTVKEAVDNSLDACEEAGILPEIWVHVEQTGREPLQGRRAGQRPRHRQEADSADLRQAALRLEVPPPAP